MATVRFRMEITETQSNLELDRMASTALLLRVFFLDGTHVRIRVANADHVPVHAALSALSSALGIDRKAMSECGIYVMHGAGGGAMRLLGSTAKLQPLPPGARFVLRPQYHFAIGKETKTLCGILDPSPIGIGKEGLQKGAHRFESAIETLEFTGGWVGQGRLREKK